MVSRNICLLWGKRGGGHDILVELEPTQKTGQGMDLGNVRWFSMAS